MPSLPRSPAVVAFGPRPIMMPEFLAASIHALFRCLARVVPGRCHPGVWVSFLRDIDGIAAPSGVSVRRVREADIEMIRRHPNASAPQLVSVVRAWERGMREGVIWMNEENPLFIQWLITQKDEGFLRADRQWGGNFLPLDSATAYVEHLHKFYFGGRPEASADFAVAVFEHARSLGIRYVRTHIPTTNFSALRWASRTGWTPIGTFSRWTLEIPWLGMFFVTVHLPGVPALDPRIGGASTAASPGRTGNIRTRGGT